MKPKPDTRITTSRVLAAIDQLQADSFTSFDLAESMGVPEYPVRRSIAWLIKFNAVKRSGFKKLWTAPVKRIRCNLAPGEREPYFATVYVRVTACVCDYDALMRAMMGSKETEPVEE